MGKKTKAGNSGLQKSKITRKALFKNKKPLSKPSDVTLRVSPKKSAVATKLISTAKVVTHIKPLSTNTKKTKPYPKKSTPKVSKNPKQSPKQPNRSQNKANESNPTPQQFNNQSNTNAQSHTEKIVDRRSKQRKTGPNKHGNSSKTVLLYSIPQSATLYDIEEFFAPITDSIEIVLPLESKAESNYSSLTMSSTENKEFTTVMSAQQRLESRKNMASQNRFGYIQFRNGSLAALAVKRLRKNKISKESIGLFLSDANYRSDLRNVSRCVTISNIAKTTPRETVRKFLHLCGFAPIKVQKGNRPWVFVAKYETPKHATAAVDLLSGRKLLNRPVFLNWMVESQFLKKNPNIKRKRYRGKGGDAELTAETGGEVSPVKRDNLEKTSTGDKKADVDSDMVDAMKKLQGL